MKKLLRNCAVALVLLTFLVSILPFASAAAPPNTTTVTINADGSITPSDASIQRDGDTYTLTGNINSQIRILKGNIVLNGAGYKLHGPYNGTATWDVGAGPSQLPEGVAAQFSIGVDLGNKSVTGVLIENLVVENFSVGMYIWTSNNTVRGSSLVENQIGILLSGFSQVLEKNYLSQNDECGLFLGINNPGEIPPNLTVTQNTFDRNIKQFSACVCQEYNESEDIHVWDNGKTGNYWSDYTGVDGNGDGIGDTQYVIDSFEGHPRDVDRYPLMAPVVKLPLEAASPPYLLIGVVVAIILIASIALVVFRKRKR
jgi:nitrous oxidase accessory protein NosD